ncbi:hypothetical protein HDU97_006500, partial [Phlyctochytrium planicorne]
MAMAMCDVIADAMVVKRARMVGSKDGAYLQTWCWIMLYVGYTIGAPFTGTILGEDGTEAPHHGIVFNTKVLLPAIWIVLRGALVPDIAPAWNYWLRNIEIGAKDQSCIDASGDISGIIGLLIFAKWFTKTKF